MSDETAPERIWLQTAGDYAAAHEAGIGSETGVTWCDMPQDEGDQEYIRADLGPFYQEKDVDAMQDRIATLEAENERLRARRGEIETVGTGKATRYRVRA